MSEGELPVLLTEKQATEVLVLVDEALAAQARFEARARKKGLTVQVVGGADKALKEARSKLVEAVHVLSFRRGGANMEDCEGGCKVVVRVGIGVYACPRCGLYVKEAEG